MDNIYISEKVAPETGVNVFSRTFLNKADFKKLTVRFYPGQELDLDLNIRLKRYGGSYISLIGGANPDMVVSGDDDRLEFETNLIVYPGEEIEVLAENKTIVPEDEDPDDYTYNFQLICELDQTIEDRRGLRR